ncbi:ABC transporter permease [Usitatibacter palustris]|uniref:Macrolide export ATP-binding/permease protein MacB n=1 Tax=Usitatibacter palustris TaxID=2732487 RepID=A0A6M4H4R2_9PROT|nr:ABC transporter permease [Usitatibacter palustris]QJR14576.1 Macrolide export ATP-binding/permease protein MacB [Usitatibacter palustris]
MNLFAIMAEAWRSLGANKLRTGLTMLGMIIGVAAVVLMLAVGRGAQNSVNRAVASMGSNLLVILSGSTSTGGLRVGSGNAPTLTASDAEAIAKLPGVVAVAPTFPGGAQIAYGINNWGTQVLGVTPEYTSVRDWPVETGDPITDTDVRSATRVALIGSTVAEKIFLDEDPIGKTMRIRNQPFTVIGVLRKKGQSLDGRDQDDSVLVPITTAQSKLFGNRFPGTVRFMFVQATSAEATRIVEQDTTALLRQRHRLQPDAEDDFTVRNLTQVAETAAGTARVLSLMLGAIGSISLIVGGIGIMNIMLVSVTERTREIGVRMAIGARRRDVLVQFLLEALMICIVGGLVGIAIGVGGAIGVAQAMKLEIELSATVALVAFAVSAATGIFFGFWPARRAASLRPVEALRYE